MAGYLFVLPGAAGCTGILVIISLQVIVGDVLPLAVFRFFAAQACLAQESRYAGISFGD